MSCATCAALRRAGVGVRELELHPPEADALEAIAPGEGYSGVAQLRRCACGALYRYRYHHELSGGRSWEEHYLWRVAPEAEQALARALDADDPDDRAEALAPLLLDPDPALREHAALYAWCLASGGAELDLALEATCQALTFEGARGAEFAYRALLAFLERGEDEAGLVYGYLTKHDVAARDPRHAWPLLKECRALLGLD